MICGPPLETDPFLTTGLAIFESFALRNGKVLAFEEHLLRLRAGALRLQFPWATTIEQETAEFLALQKEDQAIRVVLTVAGTRVYTARPLPLPENARLFRFPAVELGIFADVKHNQRGAWWWGERRLGGELLLMDGERMLETSRANIWLKRGGCWWTPPVDGRILPGVTRGLLVEQIRQSGQELREEATVLEEGDMLFISSSLRGHCPVGGVDGVELPVGEGLPLG